MTKTDKTYIALLLLIVAGGIGAWEYQSGKINAFNPDGIYIDTLLQDHSRLENILSDTSYNPRTDFGNAIKAQEAEDSAYRP